jgi:hypothetical protein
MLKSFTDFINENMDQKNQFIKDLSQTLIEKIRTASLEESTEYSVFSGMQFSEPFTFNLILNIQKNSSPNIKLDSHFKGLPWEKINFDSLGYSIDANTKMSKNKTKIPQIIIHIILNPKEEPSLYSKLYYRLIDIITHETNHLNQLGLNREPFNVHVSDMNIRNNSKKNYKYFLLKDEVESMVEGMYEKSKAQKDPLDKIFTEYLTPFIKSNYISQAEYSKILQVWVTRALELYPDVTFSNKVDHIVNSI